MHLRSLRCCSQIQECTRHPYLQFALKDRERGMAAGLLVLELVAEDSLARQCSDLVPGVGAAVWNPVRRWAGGPPARVIEARVSAPTCYHWARGFSATHVVGEGRAGAEVWEGHPCEILTVSLNSDF